jgi:hypothetical protein
MPEVVNLAMTAREKIVKPYVDGLIPHEFRTTPVSSVGQLEGTVVSGGAGATYAWVKFLPQVIKLFRKGEGDRLRLGALETDCTDAESNLQKGGSTDGARDMAIEGLQISGAGTIVKYFAHGVAPTGFGVAPTDETVIAALAGEAHICDPFGLVVPPQLQSPYLLEDSLFTRLMQLSTVRIELDTSRPFKLGLCQLYPGASGQSMLKSTGIPDASNQFLFKEGLLWKRDGKSDSDLKMVIELHRPVIMPISLVTLPGGAAVTAPTAVYQRIMVDLLGVSVSELGDN